MSQREYKFDYPFQTYEDEMKRFRTHTDNPKIVQGTISQTSIGEEHKRHGIFFKLTKYTTVIFCVSHDHPHFDDFARHIKKGNKVNFLLFPNATTAIFYVLDFNRSSWHNVVGISLGVALGGILGVTIALAFSFSIFIPLFIAAMIGGIIGKKSTSFICTEKNYRAMNDL